MFSTLSSVMRRSVRSAARVQPTLRAAAARSLSAQCPMGYTASGAGSDPAIGGRPRQWWPNALNLKVLHAASQADPAKGEFDYADEFSKCDLQALRADLMELMTDSQSWWPADYGSYAGFFIRMAWHSAGTYRIFDGRGGAGAGQLRFAPLNSWPDNGNLDKARRLLWPIKQKYGKAISWADLMIFTGNVALESGGFKTFGFSGGRADTWEPEEDVYWGPETAEDGWLSDRRYANDRESGPDAGPGSDPKSDTLQQPLGAVQMGLIYVNPQGPNGNPDPIASAKDIRETFARMAMDDEETVALIAGGHTYGKGHGAADPGEHVGPEPEGETIEKQGFGWANSHGKGNAEDTITSGLEGAWTRDPTKWDNDYFDLLFGYEWELGTGSGGAKQWYPTDASLAEAVPDAHVAGVGHKPTMFTTDIALREDEAYGPISKRFHENPDQFADAFARAWYKLTHRDMGPHSNCLGPEVPPPQLWQDPVPASTAAPLSEAAIAALKSQILASGLSVSQLVNTAWASASTFRRTDKRGGANGARIRLAPQKDWAVNKAAGTAEVVAALERVQADSEADISMADLIVLGGCAAVEEAAKRAGHHGVAVPFVGGRTDATQEQTDVHSFAVLEPTADGFRNHLAAGHSRSAEELLLDKAFALQLTAPEMTVLVGGMRVLGANAGSQAELGVFTEQVGELSNDFFVNLLDMDQVWTDEGAGASFVTADGKRRGSRVDLLFGSNSQLRAVAEHYACTDSAATFASDFATAFGKVMHLDLEH